MKLRLGILVGILMAFLSLYPQIDFQIQRGENYNGATFYYDFDESAYASYLQALIDGRPRQNSVYQGGNEPQEFETLFSIQFASAYLVAIPARLFGISADTTFLVISGLFAFLSALVIFYFLLKASENETFAAVGTLFILIFGANAAGASILKETFGFGASAFFLTFLRRYTPAVAFPFIFLFINYVWLSLQTAKPKSAYFYGLIASLCFSFLIFGYFFFWTAMLVWLLSLAVLHLILFKENRNFKFWGFFILSILLAFIPYFLLLSNRNPTTDSAQILEHTRKIVWMRPTLLVGLFVLFLTLISIKLKWLELRNNLTIFIISLAILPVLVFNQQIITGLSLQPLHYNMYILNYLVLLALVLLIGGVFKERLKNLPWWIWLNLILIFTVWGIIEVNYATKYRYGYNLRRDESYLVNRQLAELGKLNFAEAKSQITLNFDSIQGDNQPTVAPQGVLWAEHLYIGGNITPDEFEKRYFLYLYFQNRDENWLRERLQKCPNEQCRSLIGWRINPTLSFNSSKVDEFEINEIVKKYSVFIKNLKNAETPKPLISYLIIPNEMDFDLSNFENFYQKELIGQFGKFALYKSIPK